MHGSSGHCRCIGRYRHGYHLLYRCPGPKEDVEMGRNSYEDIFWRIIVNICQNELYFMLGQNDDTTHRFPGNRIDKYLGDISRQKNTIIYIYSCIFMDHLWRFLGTNCIAQRSTLWILSQPSVELLVISGCAECGTLVAAIPTRQTIVCSCSFISLLMVLLMYFVFFLSASLALFISIQFSYFVVSCFSPMLLVFQMNSLRLLSFVTAVAEITRTIGA